MSEVLDSTDSPALGARRYGRELIPGDREIPPYELKGARRTVLLWVYGAIVASALLGFAYTLHAAPLFALTALALSYYFDNLTFSYWHVEFHTEFVEIPEERMMTLCHNAFIHHYRNRSVFHERWLETRLAYIMDPREAFRPGSMRTILLIAPLFLAVLALRPRFAVAWYSVLALPYLVQGVVHEWYHNPPRNRRSFYSRPVYLFFTLLEKTGLASTREHQEHHRHDLDSLDRVEKWLDLAVPFGERLPSLWWRRALAVHVPGKTNMNDFHKRPGPASLLIGHRLLAVAAVAACYALLAR